MFDVNSLSQPVFTWRTAMSLALASDLAYQTGTSVSNICRKRWGLSACEFLANSDTECFVASGDSAVFVAFRGTESLNDWIADLNVFGTTRPYGTVHRGFVNAFEVIRTQLIAVLDSQAAGGKPVLLTGHSLGGALATIACCELKGLYAIRGIYTFGQPRLADDATHHFVETTYPNRFFRFVFDDDIVPRIPPGYRHVGKLYHFDADGFLRENLSEASGGLPEPPALSDVEFADLKATAQELKVASQMTAGGANESSHELADRSLEGLIPSVSDHRMSRYIFAIRNQLPRALEEMNESLLLRPVAALEAVRIRLSADSGERRAFPVQVRARHREWTPPASVQVESKVGAIYSMLASMEALADLQHDPGVASVKISREVDLDVAGECARSMPFVNADAVHGGQLQEKGDQSIVAIIDTGVDILHEAFLDASGHTTRIDAVWVQRDPTGPSPHQIDPATYQQTRGTLYLFNDIQKFVNDDLINGNQTTPSILRDPNGHGTHVASIAAGRAVGTFYGGVAPEARIVVVIPDMKTTPGNPMSLGYSSSHQMALEFLLAYKRKHGLPMAINLSQGMNAGAHDGMTMLEKVFDSITTKGSEQGLVIVKSAGNEYGLDGHAQVQPAQGLCVTITWNSSVEMRTDDYFEFWYHRDDELSFQVLNPKGSTSAVVDHTNRQPPQWSADGNSLLMRLTVNHPDNTDNLLVVQVFPDTVPILTGTWTLKITGVNAAGDKWLHGWVERSDSRPVKFTSCMTNDMTLSIPGTADTVVSVAASNVPPPLPIALQQRSSRGPTRNNGPKPDLYAPGDAIVAAWSNQMDHVAVRTDSGTSMAAPHVSGAMALVMSARHKKAQTDLNKPQFNALQLAQMVRKSANGYTRQHNVGVGFGGLNVLSFFTQAELA